MSSSCSQHKSHPNNFNSIIFFQFQAGNDNLSDKFSTSASSPLCPSPRYGKFLLWKIALEVGEVSFLKISFFISPEVRHTDRVSSG